jgi:hypothetical protein
VYLAATTCLTGPEKQDEEDVFLVLNVGVNCKVAMQNLILRCFVFGKLGFVSNQIRVLCVKEKLRKQRMD